MCIKSLIAQKFKQCFGFKFNSTLFIANTQQSSESVDFHEKCVHVPVPVVVVLCELCTVRN